MQVKHPSEPDSTERFRIRLPQSLKEIWERANNNKSIKEILQDSEDLREKDIKFVNGRLSFPPEIIWDMFKQTSKDIVQFITTELGSPSVEGVPIGSIIVVGGFANSNYVIYELRRALEPRGIPLVRPADTELAVLNGAVLFGHNEHAIFSRICRHTYGVGFSMPFIEKKHDKTLMFEHEGEQMVNCVFRKHVTRGQSVKLGQWIADKEYFPMDKDQTKATICIFTSDKLDPVHTTEEGCQCIGCFDVEFPSLTSMTTKSKRYIAVSLNFGGTELKVKGIDSCTGQHFIKHLQLP